jgi:WD40 repeat protein
MEKAQKTELLSLDQFFSIDPRLKQIYKDNSSVKNFIEQLPLEIKTIIAIKTFNTPPEWWYQTKQWDYEDIIYSLSFNPQNQLTMCIRNGIKTINPQTNECLAHFFPTKEPIISLTYNSDGTLLAYGSKNGQIKVITTDTHKKIFSYFTKNKTIWALSFDLDNKYLAIGHGKKKKPKKNLRVIDIQKRKIDTQETRTVFYQILPERVYGVYLHPNNLLSYSLASNKLYTVNFVTRNIEDSLYNVENSDKILALSYDNNNRFALGAFYKHNSPINNGYGYVRIIDKITKNIINHFYTLAAVYALAFTHDTNQLAVGLDNGILLIMQKHIPTIQQCMLRRIIFLWLQVEKPDKTIGTSLKLLNTIAHTYNLDEKELIVIWNSFPENLRAYLWCTINKLIQKYGKIKKNEKNI